MLNRHTIIQKVLLASVALALIHAAGCSTFNHDWKLLASEPLTPEPDDPHAGLLGRWQGEWRSDSNGHHGGLRCIIERDATDEHTGDLHARFRATYGWCFVFEYAMPMEAEVEGDSYRFSASADLGWLAGGVYQYNGTVEGDAFHATYESRGDHGVFEMTRVSP